MAYFFVNTMFRMVSSTLNFVSPSIIADVLLHPFDFATVLLQIGYDPEGIKYETATLVSVLVQYALFTFYIPYLLTSLHGLQFMGMPHPSIFYYVHYIYNKEGLVGCYRGLLPKILERIIMVSVNERVKRTIIKDSSQNLSNEIQDDPEQEKFIQTVVNSVCAQFFAVLISHPFHVLMVSSFAEFTYDKNSSFLELSRSIFTDDGYFGFFTGLTARLLGELLSIIFSLTYTTIINNQIRLQRTVTEPQETPPVASHFVNYVTNISSSDPLAVALTNVLNSQKDLKKIKYHRFIAIKQPKSIEDQTLEDFRVEENLETKDQSLQQQKFKVNANKSNFLENLSHASLRSQVRVAQNNQTCPLRAYIPLTSKLFYYIMIRDFLSKKISNPFFLVCHSTIVLDKGWDKLPLIAHLSSIADFVQAHLKPLKRNRVSKIRKTFT